MFTSKASEAQATLAALDASQAIIEFNMDGIILAANKNFLDAVGYTLDEIRGQHHSMFVNEKERSSAGYRLFWEALARGEYQAAEYKRVGKGGREIWIQASYNPIFDYKGRLFKVVKYATDVTQAVQDRIRKAAIQQAIDADIGLITDAIANTNDQVSSAASSSEQTSANVQAVASAAEELVASVKEIGRRVEEAS